MANLSIIREMCKERNITLSGLSAKINITYAGMQRILSTNSTKIETLEKIAKALNVNITVFFENKKLLQENEVSEILTSNEIIYIRNTYNTFFEKFEACKDYFIWKLISLVINKNYLVSYPYKIPNRGETIFGVMELDKISKFPRELKNIPFSKWTSNKYIISIRQMKFLHEAFYWTLFEKNIMNITDYIKDGLIDNDEILTFWEQWENLDSKYKLHN